MNIQARWNFQRGVPENRSNPATTYTIESSIDSWIMARNKSKHYFFAKEIEEQEEQIANDIIRKIESTLNDHFH